ncbi:MAG: hypothetical protein LBT14_12510 [Treponema sp.]|nr:hypothetical protein [Treponema sp.]
MMWLSSAHELSKDAGVDLNGTTGGPLVDSSLMTNVEGVFAWGNVLHVHDLVDWVTEESRRAGAYTAEWLRGARPPHQEKSCPAFGDDKREHRSPRPGRSPLWS